MRNSIYEYLIRVDRFRVNIGTGPQCGIDMLCVSHLFIEQWSVAHRCFFHFADFWSFDRVGAIRS